MKRVLGIVLVAAAAAVPMAAGAGPSAAREAVVAAQSEVVGCWNYLQDQPAFKKRPNECVFMRNGESTYDQSVYVTDMQNWKRWGRPTTKVEGTFRGKMGFKTRIKVRLSKVRNRCGQRVYTKARFTVPAFDPDTGSFRLYSCKT